MKNKVLWVEDGARHDLPHLTAPIYIDGNYDLVVAENVSDGISHVRREEFDVIIVDIRLPPGNDRKWIDLYQVAGYDKAAARLGIAFLYCILGKTDSKIEFNDRPSWIKANRIGILTVESRTELGEDLDRLGIQVFQQKTADAPDTILLDLILQVLNQRK